MSRPGWCRRLSAVVVVLLGLVLFGLVLPGSAAALPDLPQCKSAPTPEVPGRGVEAFFEPAPAVAPAAADPFAAGATTSIEEQYGYAGLRWNTYGLGCLSGLNAPEASVGTTVANWLFTLPKAITAATGAMLGAAYQPDFLSVFDPLIGTVVDALRRSVFEQWIGLMVAGLGFLIVWRARKSSLSGTTAAIGWALFVMVLATVLFRWPLAAGQAADATVVTTMSAVTAALDERDATGRSSTGQLAAANLHEALLYQVWLGGEFGDANSVAARRYGAQLFDAQALTWAQAATLSQDPAAGQQIIEAKKAKFQQIAAQVEAEDPDAYEYLTGRRTDARVGFAALSLFAVACAVPFLLTASLLVIGALVITRFAVMMFPAIATLGAFPAMRSLVIGVGNTVAAAVINAMVFGVGTAVMVKAFGTLMAPGTGLPSWLVVALLLLLTLVMWFALRPFHRLTAMAAPGRNHFADAAGALGSVTRGIGRVGGRLVTTAAGVLIGESAADSKGGAKDDAGDDKGRSKALVRRAEADGEAGPEDGDPGSDGTDGRRAGNNGNEPDGRTGIGIDGGRRENSGRPGSAESPGRRRSRRPDPLGRRSLAERSDPAGGGAARDGESLAAAEVGLSGGQAARRTPDGAGRGRGDAAAVAAPYPPARRARRGPRRSEGADLDEVLAPPARGVLHPARGGAVEDFDGEEVYALYRPDDRAGRGGRG